MYIPHLQKRLRQLNHHFRNEIGRRAVGGGGVFAQEDSAVERETKQQRLRCAEHATDGDLLEGTYMI